MTDTLTTTRDEESVKTLLRELIIELAPNQSIKALDKNHRLVDDLHYHSLALMELAFTLEDELGLEPIGEEAILNIVTAHDVETHVINELKTKGAL